MTHELDLNIQLSSATHDHQGRGVLATAIEGYKVKSPRGDLHLVLVFEPLREPLWLLRRRITHQDYTTYESLPFIKTHIRILLQGLDYMHSQGHVVHTGMLLSYLPNPRINLCRP